MWLLPCELLQIHHSLSSSCTMTNDADLHGSPQMMFPAVLDHFFLPGNCTYGSLQLFSERYNDNIISNIHETPPKVTSKSDLLLHRKPTYGCTENLPTVTPKSYLLLHRTAPNVTPKSYPLLGVSNDLCMSPLTMWSRLINWLVKDCTISCFQISLAFGLAIMALIQMVGHVSGGHINPAVTVAMAVAMNISIVRAVLYIGAQVLGAVVGGFLLKG